MEWGSRWLRSIVPRTEADLCLCKDNARWMARQPLGQWLYCDEMACRDNEDRHLRTVQPMRFVYETSIIYDQYSLQSKASLQHNTFSGEYESQATTLLRNGQRVLHRIVNTHRGQV